MNDKVRRFEPLILVHMDSAYNYARWLMETADDAGNAIRAAYLEAFSKFGGERPSQRSRAWLLKIARRHCYARRRADDAKAGEFAKAANAARREGKASSQRDVVRRVIAQLPREQREMLLLREVEDFSYETIADIVDAPATTVSKQLALARDFLRHKLGPGLEELPQ